MIISKTFEFDYGHRVWTQKLNQKYSLDNRSVCRHLHGHRGVIQVMLKGPVLPDGMVTDFKHLNWFKKWVDDHIDHKFIIDINDPMIAMIIPNYRTFGLIKHKYFQTIDLKSIKDQTMIEILEGYCIVDFVPTSENLSKWFHKVVDDKMKKLNVKTHGIIFKETPKSTSYYEPGK